jgi:gliding motility-associated-like protein
MIISSNGNVDVTWQDPQGNQYAGYFLDLYNVQPGQAGDYLLSVIDTAGCSYSNSINLVVFPLPEAAFSGSDTIEGASGMEIDAGPGMIEYLWNTGQTSQIIEIDQEGMYRITLTSMDGCMGYDSVYVQFIEEEKPSGIYIPNAFTPNGDGINDSFKPILTNPELTIEYWHLTIYNRWGEVLYEGFDPGSGWDGLYKGKPVSADMYVYRIEYLFATGPSGDSELHQGTFMLVR